jgi:putative transposase
VRVQEKRNRQPSAAIRDNQSVKTVEGCAACGYAAGRKMLGRKGHWVVDTSDLILLALVTARH